MAQTRPVARYQPHPIITFTAGALAAVIVTALVAVIAFVPFGSPRVTSEDIAWSPAVVASAQRWELERRQQSTVIDWVVRSAEDWETQRRQQGAFE